MVIDDVIDLVYNFLVVNFNFCFRELNEGFYRLFKWVVVSLCSKEWSEFSSDWLEDVFVEDLSFDIV